MSLTGAVPVERRCSTQRDASLKRNVRSRSRCLGPGTSGVTGLLLPCLLNIALASSSPPDRNVSRRLYDASLKIESARIYGNVDAFAYYFIDLLIGTPQQRVSVILDTGSGVCAFPCANCPHCGNHIDPAFDFAKSSSASWVPCEQGCTCKQGHCSYHQGYTEGSSISGYWFEDLVTLGDAFQQNPPVTARLGCHNNENNLFYTQKANGIMGVGPNRRTKMASVLGQVFADHEHVNSRVFSICLAEWGGRLVVGGPNTTYHTGPIQYVPLDASSGFYRVPLKSISLDGVVLSDHLGRTMIDSGTTYTYMSNTAYAALTGAIQSHCANNASCGSKATAKCWNVPDAEEGLNAFPTFSVTIGNVTTPWRPQAYLYRRGQMKQWCYGFAADGFNANTVLGSTWMLQQDIIFDMVNTRVGIAPANCPNHKDRPDRDPAFTTTPSTVSEATTQPVTQAPTTAATTAAPNTAATTKAAQGTSAPTSISTTSRPTHQRSETTAPPKRTTATPKGTTTPVAPGQSAFADLKLIVGGAAAAAAIAVFAAFYCVRKGKKRHKYVQHVDEPSSSMPPEIVGAGGVANVADDTFVIDDVDQWGEDDFDFGKEENALSLDESKKPDKNAEMSENIRLMFSSTSPRDLFHSRAPASNGVAGSGPHDSCAESGDLGDGFDTDPPQVGEGGAAASSSQQAQLDQQALD